MPYGDLCRLSGLIDRWCGRRCREPSQVSTVETLRAEQRLSRFTRDVLKPDAKPSQPDACPQFLRQHNDEFDVLEPEALKAFAEQAGELITGSGLNTPAMRKRLAGRRHRRSQRLISDRRLGFVLSSFEIATGCRKLAEHRGKID